MPQRLNHTLARGCNKRISPTAFTVLRGSQTELKNKISPQIILQNIIFGLAILCCHRTDVRSRISQICLVVNNLKSQV